MGFDLEGHYTAATRRTLIIIISRVLSLRDFMKRRVIKSQDSRLKTQESRLKTQEESRLKSLKTQDSGVRTQDSRVINNRVVADLSDSSSSNQ
jgi:hypothetical protein